MEARDAKDDSVTTIPHSILDLASKRSGERYKPSYLLRIINRSLKEDHYKSYGDVNMDRGRYIESKSIYHTSPDGEASIEWKGTRVTYKGLANPSYNAKKILEVLDDKIETLSPATRSEKETYFIAAFASIIVGASHGFIDGSGRGAAGLADIYVRSNAGKKLDMNALAKNDDEFSRLLTFGTISMFPNRMDPVSVFDDAKKAKQKVITIHIPTDVSEGVHKWIEDFTLSIIQQINEFDLKKSMRRSGSGFHNMVGKLAAFYKKNSIPLE